MRPVEGVGLRLVIAVVTYNSVDLLEDFLDALPDGASDVDWSLVVADNASSDGTVARLRELSPDTTVVEMGRNAGYAAGVNAAVRLGGSFDAVLVVNADVRLQPGSALTLMTAVREPGVGIAVPRLSDRDGALILSLRREPSLMRALADAVIGAERAGRIWILGEVVSDVTSYESGRDTDWAEGSTQLISRACWEACGPWDESFFLYSEETEFDLRARDRGYRTRYVPEAEAVHLEGESAGNPALWSLLQMNRVRLYAGRHDPLRSSVFWLLVVIRESSRALLGKKTSRAAVRSLLDRRRWKETPGPGFLRR